MSDNLECPVDHVTIDENRARMVAFFVLILAVLCFVTGNWLIAAFLLADFILRAFNYHNYSPLAIISGQLVRTLKLRNKPVDRAPKRFAAFVGLSFMLMILAALLTGSSLLAQVLIAIIIVFAMLESLAGFCAGCYIYTFLKTAKLIR